MTAGLTARPAQCSGDASRYSLAAQADLILHLCSACSISHVVLVGHSDGALLALMAAAAASRLSNQEAPHVMIDVHASSPVQKTPSDAELVLQHQGTQQPPVPLPVGLDSQLPSAATLQR